MNRPPYLICLLLGSNIEAESNLPRAVNLLQEQLTVLQTSSVWESRAIGSDGPNFLNAALLALSPLDAEGLKENLIRPLEARMGRVRTEDKNAPRTIDIDLILFDGEVLDSQLWQFAHLAVPVSELLPDFSSGSGESLKDMVPTLFSAGAIWIREDISDYPFATVMQ